MNSWVSFSVGIVVSGMDGGSARIVDFIVFHIPMSALDGTITVHRCGALRFRPCWDVFVRSLHAITSASFVCMG